MIAEILLGAEVGRAQRAARPGQDSDLAAVRLLSTNEVPTSGTFWLLSRPSWPPNPCLPVRCRGGAALVYSTGRTNVFVVDDRDVPPPSVSRRASFESDSEDSDSLDSFGAVDYGTNLWLSIEGSTNTVSPVDVLIRAHNTIPDLYYQCLSKTNLSDPIWKNDQEFLGTNPGTNTDLSPIPENDRQQTFFWAAHSDTLIGVVGSLDAIEPSPDNNLFRQGYFTIARTAGPDTNAQQIHFVLSGTATNGVDYTSISNSVTLAAGQNSTNIIVNPLADGHIDGTETVTLTLLIGGDYLVDSSYPALTLKIFDNLFTPVTNIFGAIGIDYSPTRNALVVSCNFIDGETNNFVLLYPDSMTNTVVTNWSGVHGVPDEVKVAIVKSTAHGFIQGDVYFGNDTNIGRLSSNGTSSNLNWAILTNAAVTDALPMRGSLYVDDSGSFGGDVIAVTSGCCPDFGSKQVWRVNSNGVPTLVTNVLTEHLEGVVTLTNDVARWGPWAGKIITGDEDRHFIYAINTNGDTASFPLGIAPEDFDIIPANQDLYCCNRDPSSGNCKVLRVSHSVLTNFVGGVVVSQAGEFSYDPASLFLVKWSNAITNFVIQPLPLPSFFGGTFEHMGFAPFSLKQMTP